MITSHCPYLPNLFERSTRTCRCCAIPLKKWVVYIGLCRRHTRLRFTSYDPVFPLQRYLAGFRVLELKDLLKSIGCSQKGRKPELFQRANDLLRHGSPKIQNKIRDIYERTNRSKRTLSYSRMARYSPMKPAISPTRGYIVHPDVKFKQHPFYQKVDSVIRPTALGTVLVSFPPLVRGV